MKFRTIIVATAVLFLSTSTSNADIECIFDGLIKRSAISGFMRVTECQWQNNQPSGPRWLAPGEAGAGPIEYGNYRNNNCINNGFNVKGTGWHQSKATSCPRQGSLGLIHRVSHGTGLSVGCQNIRVLIKKNRCP